MKKEVKNILNDLYSLDKTFKDQEEGLVKIIEKLLDNKPKVVIDEKFVSELKFELSKQEKIGDADTINKSYLFPQRIYYAVAGAAMVAVLFIAFNFFPSGNFNPIEQQGDILKLSLSPKISNLSGSAFGSLGDLAIEDSQNLTMGEEAVPRASGGGGIGSTAMLASDAAVSEIATDDMISTKMIAPYPRYSFRYVYEGELVLNSDELDVYRKVKNLSAAKAFAGQFTKADLGLLDLGSFENTMLQNISLVEDRDFGYWVNVNLGEGVISINQNWERWRDTDLEKCQDEKCFEAQRLSLEDVPSDASLIKIANSFMRERGIDIGDFGEPEIDKRWFENYERTENKTNAYIPETISVIYPTLVDNQSVYDQSGGLSGVRVNVNIKYNKVSGLSSLSVNDYEKSQYKAVTDIEKVLAVLEQGGLNRYFDEKAEKIDILLGEPKQELVQYWDYRDGVSQELLVPALIFPILEKPEGVNFYQNNIVIPLIDEMLQSRGTGVVEPVIMRTMEEPLMIDQVLEE
ncbi:hypothetical protein C0584_05400 [Candidatus Parcubacteria bacterium]|nr:MAG: hypothetical protein C0584_05400 [Candidatus Parcubacteria bacterium]